MMPLEYPKINAETPEERIKQLESFLFQMVDAINYNLTQLEKETKGVNDDGK